MMEQIPPERRWRIWDGKNVKVQFQFEPQALCIGACWFRGQDCLHLYFAFVPLVPLHVTIWRGPK